MSGPVVSLLRHREYDREATVEAVRTLLAPLGGIGRFIPRGGKVVLKPNLLFGRHPDKAITTHPAVVYAVASLAAEAGAGKVAIGESPGFGSVRGAAKAAGLLAVAEELGVEVIEFTPAENAKSGRLFPRLEVARELLEADAIINLPKLKTHCMMLMTMAVKNMFGAVPGTKKLQWHYRAGRDKEIFARALNEIALAVKPALSIVDAVVAMDGAGPSGGNPNPAGFLAAGDDPWAVDFILLKTLGIDWRMVPVMAAADRFGPHGWQDAEAVGDAPETLRPARWELPDSVDIQMHGSFIERRLPGVAQWLRNRISAVPIPKTSCIACGHCADICPAKAITMAPKPIIDTGKCIRCYCCHELCPHNEMDLRRGGWLPKLLGMR